jgi:drug/metabolite transporter (DMT)-like permease
VALQYREAATMPDDASVRLGLLVRLARRPLWLLGVVADVLGFGFQAAALARGSLVLVEPIVATSLVFSFLTLAVLSHTRPDRRELAAALLVIGGLSTFLIVAAPDTTSHDVASGASWLLCGSVVAGLIAAIALTALGRPARWRAGALAVAAGMAVGFLAVASKAFAQKLDNEGLLTALQSWEPYVLAASGILATLMIQSAYQAAAPTITFPLIEVTGPLTAAVIGVALFGENLSFDGGRAPVVIIALAVMVAGIVTLGREPIIAHPAIE